VLKTGRPRGMPLESYFPAALQSYLTYAYVLPVNAGQRSDVSHSQAITL